MVGVGGGAEVWSFSAALDCSPEGNNRSSAGAPLVLPGASARPRLLAPVLAAVLGVPQVATLLTVLMLLSKVSLSRGEPNCGTCSPSPFSWCLTGDPNASAFAHSAVMSSFTVAVAHSTALGISLCLSPFV